MITLSSYIADQWVKGTGKTTLLLNSSTEAAVAEASSEGVDFVRAVNHARAAGGPALRALSFADRGAILKNMSDVMVAHRDELLNLAMDNGGNTRSDGKFDVDGASATLSAYAELCKGLGDARYLVDGEAITLGRSSRLTGQHVLVSRHGVAVHINAFNFPSWGMAEKAACCIAAGMPFITKPATATALVAWRVMQLWIESGALPAGSAQFVAGGVGNLLDLMGPQDVLAFTGSSDTAVKLRGHQRVLSKGVHVNVEADSLNVAVAGPDVEQGTPVYDLFLKDVVKEMTQKTGQKCTAIRRILIPKEKAQAFAEDLADRLSHTKVGNPAVDDVTMGPVSTAQQKKDVLAGMQRLMGVAKVLTGGTDVGKLLGAEAGKGFFVMPTLLMANDSNNAGAVHEHEVFGPVATVLAYDTSEQVGVLAARGEGGLVASVYSDDKQFSQDVFFALAPHHGRVVVGSEKSAGQAIPPGTVMPSLVHGGPGRAGGGEELGGTRGMMLYMQRTALQGFGPWVESVASGGKRV